MRSYSARFWINGECVLDGDLASWPVEKLREARALAIDGNIILAPDDPPLEDVLLQLDVLIEAHQIGAL